MRWAGGMSSRTARPTIGSISLLGLAALTACHFDPEGGPDPSPRSDPPVRDVEPAVGGGVARDPLDDVLTVFVLDEEGRAVPGTEVVVESEGSWSTSAPVGASGRIDLRSERLIPPLSVHLFSSEGPHRSFVGVEGSVVTFRLGGSGAEEPAASSGVATLTGEVRGWHRLPAPSAQTARVVDVEAFGRTSLERFPQTVRPDSATPDDPDGMASNVAVDGVDPFPRWRSYTLRADTRAEGLVAYGWVFDASRPTRQAPSFIGVSMGLDLADGEALDAMDVELTQPIDVRLAAAGPAVGAGPELGDREIGFGVTVGPEGPVVPLGAGPISATGERRADGPRLEGVFAEGRYWYGLHYRSREQVARRPAREMRAVRTSARPDADLTDALDVPGAPELAGRVLAAAPPDRTDLGRFRIVDEQGDLRWEIWVVDPRLGELRLPAAPAGFSDGLPRGTVELEASAFDLGAERAGQDLDLGLVHPRSEAHHRRFTERADR